MQTLTERRCPLNSTGHGKHPVHARVHLAESFGYETQTLDPSEDVVVEGIVSDRDAIDSGIPLDLPGFLFDGVRDLDELLAIDGALPVFFEREFELALGSHPGKTKSSGCDRCEHVCMIC